MAEDNKAIINKESSPKKVILKLAWPVIAEHSLATITHIVDMMMVGRLGASAVAAVGLTMQPVFFSTALASALGVGTTALVSRFTGSDENQKAASVLQQSVLLSIIFSVVFAAVFYLFAPSLLTLMGGESEVIRLGTGYLRVMTPGFIFMVLGFIVTAALRGAGETKTPMKVNILVNILNIVGNYLFIFGNFGFPRLGVNGAALATTFARSVGGIILLGLVFSDYSVLKMKIKGFFRFDIALTKRVLKIGIPTAMEESVRRLAQIPMGTHFIFAGALRGAGDTKAVFYSTAISTWIFRLLLGYILVRPLGLGLIGAWTAMVIDWTVRGSYVFYRFKKGKWKLIDV